MEKTTPDYPHDPAEHAAGPHPDGARAAAAPLYAPDTSEPPAVMPPEGAEAEGEPFRDEAPAVDAALDTPQGPEDGTNDARPNRLVRELFEVMLIVALVFLGVRSAIQNFKVEGDSMLPTLQTDQYLLVNRALYAQYDANFLDRLFDPGAPADRRYLFQQPQRGDIVVFQSPSEPKDFIKRIVAVAGETVEVRADFDPTGTPGRSCGGCGVYVNGVLLDEPYVRNTPDYVVPPTLVPPGHVFVLGDNRRNSADSHVFGPLAVERIVGAAFMSYLPTDTLGFIPHPTYAEIGTPSRP
jgi:signal peptidase I